MVAFYNQGDQNIYKDFQYVPQEKYRTGFTAPVQGGGQDASTSSFGIPNTNAFTNSGGGFNQSGNAFGYGSPVEEVNVRTFNPQPYNPTGGSPFSPSFDPMANKESYGAQGQYTSPYDDTVDLGFRGRDTSTSIQREKSGLGKAFDFVTDYLPFIGPVKKGAKFISGLLPDNPNGPGGGTYSVAGLSDSQKEAYNTLAKGNMLFDGSSGLKTLTGKNFTGKGYMEGQRNIYNDFLKDFKGMTQKEIDEKIEALKNDPRQRSVYRRYQESSALFKDRLATEKALRQAAIDRQQGLIGTRGTGAQGTSSIIQGEGGGNTRGTSRASDHAKAAGLGHNAGNVRSANAAGKGSAQSHNQNLAYGGSVRKYFKGGIVSLRGR